MTDLTTKPRKRCLAEWRSQMRAVAALLRQAGEALPLRALASAFPGMTDYQQRARIGRFVQRGWLSARMPRGSQAQLYALGAAYDWKHDRESITQLGAQEPPLEHAVRLVAYRLQLEQQAPDLALDLERRHVALAIDGANELAIDQLIAAIGVDARLATLRERTEQRLEVVA